jgi:hypothetical protein
MKFQGMSLPHLLLSFFVASEASNKLPDNPFEGRILIRNRSPLSYDVDSVLGRMITGRTADLPCSEFTFEAHFEGIKQSLKISFGHYFAFKDNFETVALTGLPYSRCPAVVDAAMSQALNYRLDTAIISYFRKFSHGNCSGIARSVKGVTELNPQVFIDAGLPVREMTQEERNFWKKSKACGYMLLSTAERYRHAKEVVRALSLSVMQTNPSQYFRNFQGDHFLHALLNKATHVRKPDIDESHICGFVSLDATRDAIASLLTVEGSLFRVEQTFKTLRKCNPEWAQYLLEPLINAVWQVDAEVLAVNALRSEKDPKETKRALLDQLEAFQASLAGSNSVL